MKRKTIIWLSVGGVVLIIAGVLFWKFRSSPQYSLLQIKNALEERNFSHFEKYVDIDGTMFSLMDQVVEIFQNNPAPVEKGASWSSLALGMGLFDVIKPQLTLLLKPQIQKWVEGGKFKTEGPFDNNVPYHLPSLWQKPGSFSMTGIEYQKREGDLAILGIGIRVARFDTVLVINLNMRSKGLDWQVASLTGLSEFQSTVERLEQRRVDRTNKPIKEAMDENLRGEVLDKTQLTEENGKKRSKIKIAIENIGKKTITGYQIKVSLSDIRHHNNKEIIVSSADATVPLEKFSSGKKLDLTIPQYGRGYDDRWLNEITTKEMVTSFTIESLEFSDGAPLHIHAKWEDE